MIDFNNPQLSDAHALLQAATAVMGSLFNSLPCTRDPKLYSDIAQVGHLATAVESLVKQATTLIEQVEQDAQQR